ncbi:MAG: DUF5710 domain-containing protein [Polaromonas sp.]|nr:DUF5710 domain-containing protein [Polaromonas sp.]
MRAYFGKCFDSYRRQIDRSVVWDYPRLQNAHTLFLGRSGSGKTTQIKRFVQELSESNPSARFHIFDVHDDIEVAGASEVVFSEVSPYGLNPLRVGSDPHFGGVNKCVNSFLRIVGKVSGTLGARQTAMLRTMLLDVYRARGFDPDDPDTWVVNESESHLVSDGSDGRIYLDVPYAEKDAAKSLGAIWDGTIKVAGRRGLWWVPISEYNGGITRWLPMSVGRMHPTLGDVLTYAKRQLLISFMGSDQEAVTSLQAFLKVAKAHHKQELEAIKSGVNRPDSLESSSSAKERAASKALDAFARYLETTRTGDELEELIKYDKVDNLKSLIDRLETLKAAGIFKGERPPFEDDASIWRYRISSLTQEEKRLFVMFRLQELFYSAIERGKSAEIRDVFVLDEVHLYVDESGDDILSTLAREARKFGVQLIAANQEPKLPEGFIASLGTKVVLGIDQLYFPSAVSKMGLTLDQLRWVSPKNTLLIQMHDDTKDSGKWQAVLLRKPKGLAAPNETTNTHAAHA